MNALFNALYFRNERAEQLAMISGSPRLRQSCSVCGGTVLLKGEATCMEAVCLYSLWQDLEANSPRSIRHWLSLFRLWSAAYHEI